MTGAFDCIKDGDIIVHKLSKDSLLVFRDGRLIVLHSDGTFMVNNFMPDMTAVTVIGNGYYFRVTRKMYDSYRKAYDAMNEEEKEE